MIHIRPMLARQSGVAMVFMLIALVVMLASAVALIRSFDISLLLSGNLGFKRDLVNEGERGIAAAFSGMPSDPTTSSKSANYSATILTSNAQGIPTALVDDSLWSGVATGSDITDSATNVTIRYVIDRQCPATGAFDPTTCIGWQLPTDAAGSDWLAQRKPPGGSRPIYRISVRITGPRNTQVFLQTNAVM